MKIPSRKRFRIYAWLLGLGSALLMILSQEYPGISSVESIGKMVYWTGVVFLPLFGLHADLFGQRKTKTAAVLAVSVHGLLVSVLYNRLTDLNLFEITFIALPEIALLAIPFLKIRKKIGEVQ